MEQKELFRQELITQLRLLREYKRKPDCVVLAENVRDKVLQNFQEFFRVSINRSPENLLTFMELLCLGLAIRGKTQKQIAHWLDLSSATVNIYEKSIRKKLQAKTRLEACSKAHDRDFLRLENRTYNHDPIQ